MRPRSSSFWAWKAAPSHEVESSVCDEFINLWLCNTVAAVETISKAATAARRAKATMTSDTRSILDQLRTKKESLLKSHGPRNPLDAKITQLIGEYEALDRKDEIGFAQSRLDLCDLQLAKGDVLSALKSLAQASAFHSEKAAKKAAEIMSRINTNKYTRAVKTFKTIDVKRVVLEIIKNTENGFHKNRLQTVFSMYTKDITKAVNFSAANIPENPKAGVADFINLARTLSQRKNHMEALPQIGNVINTYFKDIIDYGGRPLIQELEERFRGNDDALAALALDEENSTPLHDFILGATFPELLSFINNSDAFLFADAMNEEDKDLLIDEFKSRVLTDLQSPHKTTLVLLQKASCTHRFWQAPEWRHGFLSVLKTKLETAPDHHGHMALALIAYMNGSNSDANSHFRKCLEGESPFTTTGATSFIASVTNTKLSNRLLDYSGITNSEYSFKDRAIVTCSDEIYFKRYAIPYLESLRRTGSNCPVHFHIAGNKIRLKPFVSTIVGFGDVSFSYETPIERTPAYYASIRFLKAPFFVEKIAACILLTDIDVAFRSDPNELIDHCIAANCDVMFRTYDKIRVVRQVTPPYRALYRYPRTYPWAQVNAACLCLTNTDMGKLAADQIAHDMAAHLGNVLSRGKRAWWVDQNSLLFTYRDLLANGAIKIGNIEDVGVPFGSFDYSDLQVVGGASPSLSPNPRARQEAPSTPQRTSTWPALSSILRKTRALLRQRRA